MNRPRFAVPAEATDCHMHIYGPESRYKVAATNPSPVPFAYDLQAYAALRRQIGLGQAGLGQAGLGQAGLGRTVVVQPTAYGADNACTLDAVAALGQARAVVVVTTETPVAELHRLRALGARGARAFLLKGGLVPWEGLHALAAHVAPLGWHVQLQFDGGEMVAREALIRALPCPVVIDHIGRFETPVTPDAAPMRALLRLLETGKVWLKASSAYGTSRSGPPDYADVSVLARTLIAAAPDRVVWGSNWPHPNVAERKPEVAALLALLADWVPDEASWRAVLVDNPARLYDF